MRSGAVDEGGAEANRSVEVFDCVLDADGVDVRRLAVAAFAAVAAEEVDVLGAACFDCGLDDHALGDAVLLAASAEQRALQVVVVDTAAFACCDADIDDILNLLEEVLIDQCFMAAVDLLALIGDVAEVVPIPKHRG
ncbi:hypothetical protein OG394_14225 [Kribbella sp. NBC_01245]|nr:hypothetical protein [Kribbella sp. NBC_01245]